MPRLFLLLLTVVSAVTVLAAGGASAKYVGGTVSALPEGADCRLALTDEVFLEIRCRKREYQVCYETVNLLEYGQNVNRRLALAIVISPLFLLSKSRRHYLTLGFTDGDLRQQALVFQVDKDAIRSVLVALEARTGLKVQFQDDEARKAGKG